MFTNEEIRNIALRQSAIDQNCEAADFLKNENLVFSRKPGSKAKIHYREPIACSFVSYGSNTVASVQDEFRSIARAFMDKFSVPHCFEAPSLHWLDEQLNPTGHKVCLMAEYYLPDMTKLNPLPCRYETRLLRRQDFAKLYLPQWSNALCGDRKQWDVLAVGAFDNDRLVGLAGCSADCAHMWRIGVDVLPAYRRRGIASGLTAILAAEILNRGKVPFTCTAWSDPPSVRSSLAAGFVPGWREITVKSHPEIDEINR